MSGKMTMKLVRLAVLIAAVAWVALPAYAVDTATDSAEVTRLLSEAKTHAVQLRDDTSQLEAFSRTKLSWETHSSQINRIKEHINDLGKVMQKLKEERESASVWQQEAIDRVNPVLAELAASVESTIEHINQNQSRLEMRAYKDYVKANYELATRAAAIVSDFVEYGQTKAKFEKLGQRLEIAER